MVGRSAILTLALLLSLKPVVARADLAIASNDGKQIQKGEAAGVTSDSISVLDMGRYPPRVIGSVTVPVAMIGPPNGVAVGPGEAFAIVTASQKYDASNPAQPAPDDRVSVIDLRNPSRPEVLQTLRAGSGASGVAVNRAGTLVLVAAKGEDAIIVFRLDRKKLIPAGRVDLGKGGAPTDVVFSPDGARAYAVAWGVTKIMEMDVNGSRVARTGKDVATGHAPYGAVVTPDGAWLINTNVGGALGKKTTGTITMVNLKTHRLAASVEVGRIPEHVALSPDGRHVAVVLANGTAYVKSDPRYGAVLGILKIYAVGQGRLTEVARADTCHWAQGASWSGDGRLILQQCASEREIQVFRFDGRKLARDPAATLTFESRPGSIATRTSR